MRKAVLMVVVISSFAVVAQAVNKKPEFKLRDVDMDGQMGVQSSLTLTADFDVKKENAYDPFHLDFYILIEGREKGMKPFFFHSRITHRFVEEGTGYTSGVTLDQKILQCIEPRDVKYAVVLISGGKEVGVENSEDDRWWESDSLGEPIEQVLARSFGAPYVRNWETDE